MQYQISAETNIGNFRTKNEDNFFCRDIYKNIGETVFVHDGFLSVDVLNVVGVFDGMGGLSNGEKASYIAVRVLGEYLKETRERGRFFEHQIVLSKINQCMCEEMSRSQKRMGSTAVIWSCQDRLACISNLGDSRGYIYRNGLLKQLSCDHTEQQSMIELQRELGLTKMGTCLNYNNTLTQHLGIAEEEFILEPAESGMIQVQEEDIFLLCSDGLTGELSDREIADILKLNTSLTEKKDLLIEKTLQVGGKDNITVVLIKV